MGLEYLLDISVLKISGLLSSVYLSLIIIELLLSKRSSILRKQAFGFLMLFFISLLMYFVI